MVLMIFSYAIACGVVVELSAEQRERLSVWIRLASIIASSSRALIGTILVYLAVDFATDIAEIVQHHHDWGF